MEQSITGRTYAPNFNALRLALAGMVIFSHSFALLGLADPVEALVRTTTPGGLAVDGFFLISGYLIAQSWLTDPSIGRFLARRVLRIYPAFIVASLISVFIVGPLGADTHTYFEELDVTRVFRGLATLHDPQTPHVFAGTPVGSVNGSMWTISFEFRCYLLVILCGLLGLLKRRRLLLMITFLLGAAISYTAPVSGRTDSQHLLFGIPALRVSDFMAWFAALFLTGVCYFVFREKVRYTTPRWLAACAVFILSLFFPGLLRPGVLLAGSYALFGVAVSSRLSLDRKSASADISYGLYLYGWPVQKLASWYLPHIGPWTLCALTLLTSGMLALLSWRLVEHPALQLKPKNRMAPAAAAGVFRTKTYEG